ncbi:MAG: hypothetical protein WBW78_11300 [Terrimicrobiaceae bacterium]
MRIAGAELNTPGPKPNAAIAVEFDLKSPLLAQGSAVTGLHRIGSMNAGSERF